MNEAELQAALGRTSAWRGVLDPFPARALAAALDHRELPRAGDPLPPFWHHLYGHEPVRAADTGPDGHRATGSFLPKSDLPRRMWAGGRLRFFAPLRLGERVRRTSRIARIQPKRGRSGRLLFVTVEHLWEGERGPALVEEQDIVYREPVPLSEPPRFTPPADLETTRRWLPDEVLLFRYSALTYNGHRIHYDQRYARQVEGYPDLVVHGPLIATLMLELVREVRPDVRLVRFDFRARAPLFVRRPLVIGLAASADHTFELWAWGEEGPLAMEGRAELAGS